MVRFSSWQPNDLWAIVDRVRVRVTAALGDGPSSDFFRRETALFDTVTHISGILKPLKPELRRGKIAEQLKRIPLDGDDLYLPTNPQVSSLVPTSFITPSTPQVLCVSFRECWRMWVPTLVVGRESGLRLFFAFGSVSQARVVAINTESGRPLQSAAKVPIMVTFTVRIGDTHTSQTDPLHRSAEEAKASSAAAEDKEKGKASSSAVVPANAANNTSTVPQALIFKVGDDCRQDVLALQVRSRSWYELVCMS